jgi:hypothetical protein
LFFHHSNGLQYLVLPTPLPSTSALPASSLKGSAVVHVYLCFTTMT